VGGERFGELLRRLRLAGDLTQEALAARALISTRAVSDLERGINLTARRHTADLLADALDRLDRSGPPRDDFLDAASGRARRRPHHGHGLVGRDRDIAALRDVVAPVGDPMPRAQERLTVTKAAG